jgi:hypothetical protein
VLPVSAPDAGESRRTAPCVCRGAMQSIKSLLGYLLGKTFRCLRRAATWSAWSTVCTTFGDKVAGRPTMRVRFPPGSGSRSSLPVALRSYSATWPSESVAPGQRQLCFGSPATLANFFDPPKGEAFAATHGYLRRTPGPHHRRPRSWGRKRPCNAFRFRGDRSDRGSDDSDESGTTRPCVAKPGENRPARVTNSPANRSSKVKGGERAQGLGT